MVTDSVVVNKVANANDGIALELISLALAKLKILGVSVWFVNITDAKDSWLHFFPRF
jgi:hypothetical protein